MAAAGACESYLSTCPVLSRTHARFFVLVLRAGQSLRRRGLRHLRLIVQPRVGVWTATVPHYVLQKSQHSSSDASRGCSGSIGCNDSLSGIELNVTISDDGP